MKRQLIVTMLTLSTMAVAACTSGGGSKSGSSYNPFISFGDSSSQPYSKKSFSEMESSSSIMKPKTLDDCNGTERSKHYGNLGYISGYNDINFKKNLRITKTDFTESTPYHGSPVVLHDKYSSSTPNWTMAQWGTRYDIKNTASDLGGHTLNKSDDGLINTITSKGKTVNGIVIPAKVLSLNSYTGEIYMESNCSVEYETPREGYEPWVHLLLESNLTKEKSLSQMTSCVMEADYEVNYCDNKTGEAYNPNVHAAQLVWYITLQNLNNKSAEYGKYIWFGVSLFDNRDAGKETSLYYAFDAGTGTAIYNLGSSYYMKDKKIPTVGERKTALIDIRPYVEEAFNIAKKDGYFETTVFTDLYLGSSNFGYEVPGTFDISSTIHSINVYYK